MTNTRIIAARTSAIAFAAAALATVPQVAHADATPECNAGVVAGQTECGANSSTSGLNSTAIGDSAAAAQRGTAVGQAATITTGFGVAVGHDTRVNGDLGTAVGAQARVTGNSSVAIGAGSTDGGNSNVVSVGRVGGERTIINVGSGAVTANSTDAVNGSQLFAVNATATSAAADAASAGVITPRRRGRPPMQYHAALDTSATTTAICVVRSQDGEIALETSVTTDPEAIWRVLKPYADRLLLVGHEATGWSAWLHRELEARGLPMVLLTAAAHPPVLSRAPGRKNAPAPNQRTGQGKRRERYAPPAMVRQRPPFVPIRARCYEAKFGVGMRGSTTVWDRRLCCDAPKAAPAKAHRVGAA
jgi:hypothetical protein